MLLNYMLQVRSTTRHRPEQALQYSGMTTLRVKAFVALRLVCCTGRSIFQLKCKSKGRWRQEHSLHLQFSTLYATHSSSNVNSANCGIPSMAGHIAAVALNPSQQAVQLWRVAQEHVCAPATHAQLQIATRLSVAMSCSWQDLWARRYLSLVKKEFAKECPQAILPKQQAANPCSLSWLCTLCRRVAGTSSLGGKTK